MADNVTTQTDPVSSVAPGVVIATDQLIDGSHVQKVKILSGAADATTPVLFTETANGLKVDGSAVTQPVSGPVTDAQLRASPVPISGSVTVSDGSGPITVDGTVAISGTVPVSASALPLPAGAATDATLVAEIGAVSTAPGAYTVNDRLNQIALKIDSGTKVGATEVTMRKLLAALSRPTAPSYSTLLHR